MKGSNENKRGITRNDNGEVSGSKLVLLFACVFTCLWLGRDLILDRPLTEGHILLLCVLLVVGLLNRISGRGQFRVKLGKDGAEIETNGGPEL